jgi:hypothetical protein
MLDLFSEIDEYNAKLYSVNLDKSAVRLNIMEKVIR